MFHDDLAIAVAQANRPPRGEWLMRPDRPPITCLCGSTRFKQAFIDCNRLLTEAGHIILTVGFWTHDEHRAEPSPELKAKLDALHLRKVELADQVLVIDLPAVSIANYPQLWDNATYTEGVERLPYIGESTRGEIKHAEAIGVPVYYLGLGNLDYLCSEGFMTKFRARGHGEAEGHGQL